MGLIRFILAITVVIAHSGPIFGLSFVGGKIAVQAFFIISGFYMALILKEKYVGTNGSYALFITNRFLRLYPIYWTVLLLTILYSVALVLYSHGTNYGRLSSYSDNFNNIHVGSLLFLIGTNLVIFLQDLVMFLGLDTATGHLFFTSNFQETDPRLHGFLLLPQAWTISIELGFYLIAPFLVRRKARTILVLILVSFMLRATLARSGFENDPWSHRFFPSELAFFLLGIISYHLYVKLRRVEIRKVYLTLIWSGVLGVTVCFSLFPIPHKYEIYMCMFFISLPFVFLLTKKWKYDAYIGELSYPIYISHLLILSCMKTLGLPKFLGAGLTLTVLTVLFSILLNEFVAKRIEKRRQGRIRPSTGKALPL